MEAQLQEAEQKLKQLEHEKKEESKIAEIKQQEQNVKIDQYEKVIMMMAMEIKNLQDGKETEIGDEKEAVLKKAKEKLEVSETEKNELANKLEDVKRERNNAMEKVDILTKVVESVNNNKNIKEPKTKKNKKNIKCRDFTKANGCMWGERCKFSHGEEEGLVKEVDCSYWMEGSCRFSDQVCWNIHNPAKKGSTAKEQQNSAPAVFREGREQESLGQENEGWEEARSRRNKRRMRAAHPEKEIQGNLLDVDGQQTNPCQKDGLAGQETPTFPRDGEASQQMVLQALQALLRQAGVNL